MSEDLEQVKAQAEGYLGNWQRTEEDFGRYKKFAEHQMSEAAKFGNKALILSLLPVLDDLERAFTFVPDHVADAAWVDQIRLVHRSLWTVLEAQGVARIDARGQAFDPSIHEAAAQGAGEEGMVVEELRKGYKLHDRVIRPAYVIVGNGKP